MRRTAFAAGGAALAIALAGCGGTTEGNAVALFDSADALVDTASSQTSQSKTAKFTMDMSMAGMTVSAQGAARFDGPNTAMSMTMQMMGKTMEMRMVDQTVYMKSAGGTLGNNTPGGKPWVKVSGGSGSVASQFNNLGQRSDPTEILKQVQKAGTIVKSEKTELKGAPVSHYWIELDFAKIAKQYQLPPQLAGKLQGKLADVKLPLQVWLNSDQLPVKITMDMSAMMRSMAEAMKGELPAGAPSGTLDKLKSSKMKMTMTYTDWGEPVTITAPPADKVATTPN